MPLVGPICCQDGLPSTFERCKECARGFECQYPLAILAYMERNERKREGISYSATSIIGCARRQILQRQHDFYEHPKDSIARFIGDAVHEFTAHQLHGEVDYEGERRLFKVFKLTVPGEDATYDFTISGKPDQEWNKITVLDLKTSSRIPKAPYPEHEAQVNVYAWLLSGGEDPVAGSGLDFPYKIWRKISKGYITYISKSDNDTKTFEVPIWPKEKREDFIARKLSKYLPWIKHGELPEVLPAKISYRKVSKLPYITRDWHCDYCPVRAICDNKALADTGMNPNGPEYWLALEMYDAEGIGREAKEGSSEEGDDGRSGERICLWDDAENGMET